MLRSLAFGVLMLLAAGAAPAAAKDNAPSDETDMRFFLCMAEGGTEINIPFVGILCCNPEWCVLCDSNLNNCRDIPKTEARRLQTKKRLTVPQTRPNVLSPIP